MGRRHTRARRFCARLAVGGGAVRSALSPSGLLGVHAPSAELKEQPLVFALQCSRPRLTRCDSGTVSPLWSAPQLSSDRRLLSEHCRVRHREDGCLSLKGTVERVAFR